jgi:hypothetical protein
MSDLHEELDAALRTITPREAPVEAAMRRGRRLRFRRRLGAAAGVVAIAVFAAVGYPALTRPSAGPRPAPVQHQRIVVTDEPPAMGSPEGVIALGTVGGGSWEISAEKPDGQQGKSALPQCFDISLGRPGATGVGSSRPAMVGCGLTEAASQEPATFTGFNGFGDGLNAAAIGTVAPDVTYIMVTLADGQQLKLIPVSAYGERLVAYVTPLDDQVVKAVAYLGNGQYLTAVPFRQPGSVGLFGLWLSPGDKAPPTDSAVLTTGTAEDIWSQKVTAYEGPWGTCWVIGRGDSACVAAGGLKETSVLGYTGDRLVIWGSAAEEIGRIVVTVDGGPAGLEVPMAPVGDEKVWAFALAKGQKATSLKGYDAFGHLIWTGKIPH